MAIRRRPILMGLVAVLWITVLMAFATSFHRGETEPVDSFSACADAGYPVTDGNPSVCRLGSYYLTGTTSTADVKSASITSQPFTLLAAADTGTSTERANVVIRTQAAWTQWWQKVHAGLTLPPMLPVDFTKNYVVILIQGPKATDGYGYKITGISQAEHATVVDTSESIPTIGCPVQEKQSNRYYIARTPILPDPVVFRNTLESRHCAK